MTIRSMTGYGQGSAEVGQARVVVELRSLNHRFADLRLRLPAELAADEQAIRRKILARIKRGRVELAVNVEPIEGNQGRPQLNRDLLDAVLDASRTVREQLQIEDGPDLRTILSVPGMFRTTSVELAWTEEQREALARSVDQALQVLERDRDREGQHLQQELRQRLSGMSAILERIRVRAAALPGTVRDRLVERLKTLAGEVGIDPQRVAQEAAILADRSDVTEELVRLAGHLEQAVSLLEQPDGQPVGKRLDFLMQEINRETNTVNSKSADLELSREALALKAELEKVREQIQNVE